MTPLEKYVELQRKYGDKSQDLQYPLTQYLTIAQMLVKEEKCYKNHRRECLKWLKNIEKWIVEEGERE